MLHVCRLIDFISRLSNTYQELIRIAIPISINPKTLTHHKTISNMVRGTEL